MSNTSKDKWLIKSYNNHEFLNSPAARTIRILTEMIEPAERLRRRRIWNTVVFFGSARTLSRQQARKQLKELQARLKNTSRPSSTLKQKIAEAERSLQMSRYYEDACLLSEQMTQWFQTPEIAQYPTYVCSGGGPGIMEAANKGAKKAKGQSIGLNISLPLEQHPNIYQTREMSFEFHYFFIRKFWFFYLAKALVVFPGGFGTMDELFELLTLIQTKKTKKYMPVVLYGKDFWNEIINFDALLKWGMISKEDLKLFKVCDSVPETVEHLKKELMQHLYRQQKKLFPRK